MWLPSLISQIGGDANDERNFTSKIMHLFFIHIVIHNHYYIYLDYNFNYNLV